MKIENMIQPSRFDHIPTVIPNLSKLKTQLKEDCNAVTFRKYDDKITDNIWVAGINEDGHICPEEVWVGNPLVKGIGYGGATVTWTLEDGEVLSIAGPSHAAPSFLVKNTIVRDNDIRPMPIAIALYIRELRPPSDPVRRRTGESWKEKYIYADENIYHGDEHDHKYSTMRDIMTKYPDIHEICYEIYTKASKESGCVLRHNIIR